MDTCIFSKDLVVTLPGVGKTNTDHLYPLEINGLIYRQPLDLIG